jgi:hypothetical protein
VVLRSKVKDSEWRNFGVEWLLEAANGDEPKKGSEKVRNRALETHKGCGTLRYDFSNQRY